MRAAARRARPAPTRPAGGSGAGRAAAAAIAVVLLAGCGASAASLPPQPATVRVAMRDHAFELDPEPPVPAGRVVFHARNVGEADHELVVVDVADDPANEGGGPQVVTSLGVIHARAPGEHGRVAVDLAPGRYALVCLVRDDDGVTHAEHGQRVDFEVR